MGLLSAGIFQIRVNSQFSNPVPADVVTARNFTPDIRPIVIRSRATRGQGRVTEMEITTLPAAGPEGNWVPGIGTGTGY